MHREQEGSRQTLLQRRQCWGRRTCFCAAGGCSGQLATQPPRNGGAYFHVGSIAETLGWEGEGEEALVQCHRCAYLVHTTLSVGLPHENGRYIPPELVAATEVSSAGRQEEQRGAKEDNDRADTYLEVRRI